MFTYNITFVTEVALEHLLIDYLVNTLIPDIRKRADQTQDIEIKKLVEAGGFPPDENSGVSIAIAVGFSSEKEARLWYDQILLPALTQFTKKIGDKALYFITLLQTLSH